ncbi:hypothetical protein D9613_009047 [Agrocybe pediades]|uniref:ABM domain-containing protein n=1 Tax=Agrocybe pediades TaxID=84607 RepID=A0A8H4VTZ1_9AGAR|nr:hypothetical protein D9613_009047 [Agrocybe pediades]KAF9562385.1 hypothetical protein CPC08DRAFT_817180 [Agrocybe pediades]
MSSAITQASLVPLFAQAGKESTIEQFLLSGLSLAKNEPATIQWFAAKVRDPAASTPEYIIFDTFPDEEGRKAHFAGDIPKALHAHGAEFLARPPDVSQVACEILVGKVVKVDGAAEGDVKMGYQGGLRVLMEAKPGKREALKEFLKGAEAMLEGEPGTLVWYAVHFTGTDKFAVVDFFATEEGRQAHLKGKIAAALFASVEENMVGPPEIKPIDVIGAKV